MQTFLIFIFFKYTTDQHSKMTAIHTAHHAGIQERW